MCYAYKPGRLPGLRVPENASETADGFYYARDTVPVLRSGDELRLMRWDLIPRGFLRLEKVTLAEAVRKKNSRAVNPETGKSWGFSSYNARIETVENLWTFKEAWRDGNRAVLPVEAFRERPNMDGAPEDSKGREYEVRLDGVYFLAALFDTWKSKDGETQESCTVITGPSDGVPALQAIWHERVPILLSREACKAWLDPATRPREAMALLRAAAVPPLTVAEVPRPASPTEGSGSPKKTRSAPKARKEAAENPGPMLDLFAETEP
jgi:putative SOS response-associated peptidase YedK